jgi:hypothetical protein
MQRRVLNIRVQAQLRIRKKTSAMHETRTARNALLAARVSFAFGGSVWVQRNLMLTIESLRGDASERLSAGACNVSRGVAK